jgi:coatomer subunit beta
LVSRIQYKGILEPLQTALIENVSHKHVYVRRNAVVCLYEIFLNSGDDLVSDVDEMMEKMLVSETDLSTKRNAFLLLFHANQSKALEYLTNALSSDDQDMGDIMQLAILELFRKVCKLDPSQKPKLLKSIFHFTKSKSPSVLFETANTLAAVSPTPTSLRLAVGIYMQLLSTQTDNNVKLVVLERIEHLSERVLEDKVIDLASLLSQ